MHLLLATNRVVVDLVVVRPQVQMNKIFQSHITNPIQGSLHRAQDVFHIV